MDNPLYCHNTSSYQLIADEIRDLLVMLCSNCTNTVCLII